MSDIVERDSRCNALIYKALSECQRALCPEWGDCAENLKDGEKCACGFEDGPYANAVPKNRAAEHLRAINAELAEACRDYIAWCSPNTIGEPELKRIREKIRAAIAHATTNPVTTAIASGRVPTMEEVAEVVGPKGDRS